MLNINILDSNLYNISCGKRNNRLKEKDIWHSIFYYSLSALIIFLFVVISPYLSYCQQLDDAVCVSGGRREMDYRKKPWKGNNQFLETYLEKIKYFEERDIIRFSVPLKFWVYRNNHGEGGASYEDIKKFLTDLNENNRYNQTGIQYYIREIEFVDRTARQVFGYYLEAPVQTFFRHTKPAINIYLVDRFKKKQESRRLVKGTYNIFTKSVIIQRENSSTALAHEIGHYFGLLHPHRHYEYGKSKQEPVSRTRTAKEEKGEIPLCEMKGDLLSDTEAEPKLTFLVDNDCNFTGNVLKDAWGDNYRSVVNNIMSYPTHTRCRNSFTLQQKSVMLYSAATNKYGKYWNMEYPANMKYLFDKHEPDNYKEMASIIDTGTVQDHSFHKIFIKPGKDNIDTTDWIKFEVKNEDKRNIKVIIYPAADNQNSLQAILYDKNLIPLATSDDKQPTDSIQLGFENVVSDWYYIYINNPYNKQSDNIETYQLRVELY